MVGPWGMEPSTLPQVPLPRDAVQALLAQAHLHSKNKEREVAWQNIILGLYVVETSQCIVRSINVPQLCQPATV